jgi:hypothetical protein
VSDLSGEPSRECDVVEDFSKLLLAAQRFNSLTQQTVSRHGGSQTTLQVCFAWGKSPVRRVIDFRELIVNIYPQMYLFSRS